MIICTNCGFQNYQEEPFCEECGKNFPSAEPPDSPSPVERLVICPYCKGHGADPMSDNVNCLPCPVCKGKGKIKKEI